MAEHIVVCFWGICCSFAFFKTLFIALIKIMCNFAFGIGGEILNQRCISFYFALTGKT
jgi:hypothetical protein